MQSVGQKKNKTHRQRCNATITRVLNTSGANYKILFLFFCYVNFKLGRFLVNIKNGVFSLIIGRYETPLWAIKVKL